MFKQVHGFFHKSVVVRDERLLQPPVIFDNSSETVLVEMSAQKYQILSDLFNELGCADFKYREDPMTEPKVGAKTIECELVELQREVERSEIRPEALRKEAVQVMTMGYKFIRDICDKEEEPGNG